MQIDNGSIKREHILQDINQLLLDYGFQTSNIYDRSCFDILARKKDILIVLKILVNIDSLSNQQAEELRKVAGTFLASPIIIGMKSKHNYLEEDVVYERHEIPAISPQTFCNVIVNDIHPEIFAQRGGYYVQINGKLLKALREKQHLSLKELADISHVSRETIYKYEQGISQTYPETAMMIESVLNRPITVSINILKTEKENSLDTKIQEPIELIKLGFEINSSNKTPFDAITQQEKNDTEEIKKLKQQIEDKIDEIEKLSKEIENQTPEQNKMLITNMERNRNEKTLKTIALNTGDISKVTGYNALFVLEHEQEKNSINNIPIIYTWELEEMDKAEDVLDLVKERKKESEEE